MNEKGIRYLLGLDLLYIGPRIDAPSITGEPIGLICLNQSLRTPLEEAIRLARGYAG